MNEDDVAMVMSIQRECYASAMVEEEAVICARLATAGAYAWVAEDGDGVCAYLFCYPSLLGIVTALGAKFDVPDTPDCLYLHDLAVSRRSTGKRLGPGLVRAAWTEAAKASLSCSALIAVQGSRPFWEKLGYAVHDGIDQQALVNLQTYLAPCWYMVRRL